jgi:hypothetical protein
MSIIDRSSGDGFEKKFWNFCPDWNNGFGCDAFPVGVMLKGAVITKLGEPGVN